MFSYILVLRVRDGQIVSLRDYLNPQAMATAADGVLMEDVAEQAPRGPRPTRRAGARHHPFE